MKNIAAPILLMLFMILLSPFCGLSQEENSMVVKQGTRYVNLKVKALDKYNSRLKRQQDHLLKKLKKREAHLAHKFKNTDSAAYARYQQQPLSYDSISNLSKEDTGENVANLSYRKNATVDSLRGVQTFVQSKSGSETNNSQDQLKSPDLNALQGKINYRDYVSHLINEHTDDLKNIAASVGRVPGLIGIEKQVFYGKAKMNAFKEMEEDPTKAEDKAMEYLQGADGFDKYMKSATTEGSGGMEALGASGAGAAELEQMGYQTKHQMQQNLQQQFGGDLGSLSQQVSQELADFQKSTKEVTGELSSGKQSLEDLQKANRPSFKVNEMRGKPFWQRIEKQYNWQTSRATTDGKQPALLDLSAMAGFKHTPKLIYGVGIATSFGLGQTWQKMHCTFQGVGAKSFATWEWQYGLGAYAGYERMYNQAVFINDNQSIKDDTKTPHSSHRYSESVLIGVIKSYHINDKWTGEIQLLYDIWWLEKGLRSPIVLRFATIK